MKVHKILYTKKMSLSIEEDVEYLIIGKDVDMDVRVEIKRPSKSKVILRGISKSKDICIKGIVKCNVEAESELIIEGYRHKGKEVCVMPGLETRNERARVSHSARVKTITSPLYLKARGINDKEYESIIEGEIYGSDH